MDRNIITIIRGIIEDYVKIRELYPRYQGTMIMVDPDKEDQLESMITEMLDHISVINNMSDAEIVNLSELNEDNDINEFRHWITDVEKYFREEMNEVYRAREFLSRYYSH